MELLTLYLLEWLDARDRTYEEVMETWHTPIHVFPFGKKSIADGFVTRGLSNGSEVIHLASGGATVLRKHLVPRNHGNYLKVVS